MFQGPNAGEDAILKAWMKFAALIAAIPFFFVLSLIGWRVDYFYALSEDGELVFATPAANGNRFTTRYIHSVEGTPVEDEYRITDGMIWMWEERVRSTNAGLPFAKPAKGRFITTDEWLIYQGGRNSVTDYYYRIGDQHFGLNQVNFDPYGLCDLYKIYKGERLRISVRVKNLAFAKHYVSSKLAGAQINVPPIMHN